MRAEKPRRSPNLKGVRELMREPKSRKPASLVGVRETLQEPKARKSASLTGVRELMKETKVSSRKKHFLTDLTVCSLIFTSVHRLSLTRSLAF